MPSSPPRAARPRVLATLALLAFSTPWAFAAQQTFSAPFSFPHTATVSSGLVSIGGTFSQAVSASAQAATLPQFNPALGRLTKVTVSAATSSASFSVAPAGLLSLVSTATAVRRLGYSVTSNTSVVTDAAEVTTTGAGLLTLLGLGGGEIGGAALASSKPLTADADLARFTGSGTAAVSVTATNTLTIFTLVSVLNGAGLNGSGSYAGTVSVTHEYTPWSVSGYVYLDADHDGVRAPAEAGTGLTLYAKLLDAGTGAALQAATVHAASGLYSFTAAAGSYRVIVDDNASLADTTALQLPAGWSATQASGLSRSVVLGAEPISQDFGLIRATTVSGRAFLDAGAGGGVANDGIGNGAEPGLAGRSLLLLAPGGVVLDRGTALGDGSFRLYIPSNVSAGTVLTVQQAADAAFVPTGGSAGNTGGSYSRGGDAVSFAFAAAAPLSALAFGSVRMPTLSSASAQSAAAGATVTHAHQFVASTSGSVAFNVAVTQAASPWSAALYWDVDGNGVVDAADAPIAGPIAVTAGQRLALLVKVMVPREAPPGDRVVTTLSAQFALANAAPALNVPLSAADQTVVATGDGGLLTLSKSASTASVAPGGSVVYTIVFTNYGTRPIGNIVVRDTTPPFTRFVSAAADTVPSGLGAPTIAAPGAGNLGDVVWTFPGELPPGASGTVRFTVVVD